MKTVCFNLITDGEYIKSEIFIDDNLEPEPKMLIADFTKHFESDHSINICHDLIIYVNMNNECSIKMNCYQINIIIN
jgi:hypothetical protein